MDGRVDMTMSATPLHVKSKSKAAVEQPGRSSETKLVFKHRGNKYDLFLVYPGLLLLLVLLPGSYVIIRSFDLVRTKSTWNNFMLLFTK